MPVRIRRDSGAIQARILHELSDSVESLDRVDFELAARLVDALL